MAKEILDSMQKKTTIYILYMLQVYNVQM